VCETAALFTHTHSQALFGQTGTGISNLNPWSCCSLNSKNMWSNMI